MEGFTLLFDWLINGVSALARAEGLEPRLIVTDCNMLCAGLMSSQGIGWHMHSQP